MRGQRKSWLTALGVVVAVTGVTVLPLAAVAQAGPRESGGRPPAVEFGATPSPVTVSGLPCLSGGDFTVSMTNTSSQSLFADMTLAAPAPITLSRRLFSTYLPAADPDQTVSTSVLAKVPRDATPGQYEIELTVDRRTLAVPVEVQPIQEKGPGDNLALGEQAFASSTHGNVTLCGGVDGNTDSEQWGASGTHDATAGVFPDTYGMKLPALTTVARVELYTLDSAKYPAAKMGLRDFDIQLHTSAGWQTVDAVRGNVVGHVTATFPAVEADKVQVVTYDSNDHKYSRIVELEVYAS
jgi:NedA-like, galactose-binding domain